MLHIEKSAFYTHAVMNNSNNSRPVKSNLSYSEMSHVLSRVLANGNFLAVEDTALIFYDLTCIEDRIKCLKETFPENSLHAIAMKANPLTRILRKINTMDVGIEVASLPELYLAQNAGFTPENIVFDSPCKTRPEIEYALQEGIYINADSLDELDRIAEILSATASKSKIGLRINPQVGTGSIKSTSVAGKISKFGVPLNENRKKILAYYHKYHWLTGIHVHTGSQGCAVSLLVEGIWKVFGLALDINMARKQDFNLPLTFFDIGGGLPVSYFADKEPVTLSQYCEMLQKHCSELFSGEFRIITEFGRYIYANAAWVATKAEYVKRGPSHNIILTHVGADLFLRKCYNPGDWHHHISVVDKNGKQKTGTDPTKYIVAGPLCFAGDILAKDLELPVVVEGDYILVHDVGAYTLSMWSRYNSRQMPKVIGYRPGNDTFEILKERETTDDMEDFWS